ncbi:MAG: hypothetical protein ABUT39_30025 [Acidobacteriota bacterium]
MSQANLRQVQRNAARSLWLPFGIACLVCAVLLAWAWRVSLGGRLRLEDGHGALADALKWPWRDFPGIVPVERETIQREFKLDDPLMAADLRLWMDMPEVDWARPRSPAALEELEKAMSAMRSLPPLSEVPQEPARPGEETPYDPPIRSLSRANNAQPSLWIVLYDRGVLQYRKGNFPAARRDLEAALRVLKPLLDSPTASVYEAAIHSQYALGHALNRGGDGEPADQAALRKAKAIGAFREAIVLVPKLWKTEVEPYNYVVHPLTFFELRPTNLSTGALTSDLVAAYMRTPGYHDCEEKPQGNPCENRDRRSACFFRDRVFCNSSERAGGHFGPPFLKLFRAFYAGNEQAWNEEYRLWALSNAVDRMAENSSLGEDPYLLYNLGSLLIQVGEFEPAADLLDQSAGALTGSELIEDQSRITRLAAVASILAGRAPRGSRTGGRQEPSDVRALFRRLYEKNDTLKVSEFAAVGDEFEPSARALLDRWLFLRLWRQLLNEGQFESFGQEYARLIAESGTSREFFRRWHDEAMTDFGKRALSQAEAYDKAGEKSRAALIRRFLSDSGQFPAEITHQARGWVGWVGWAWRKSWPWALTAVLLLLLIRSGLRRRAVLDAYQKTFFSAHRQSRLGGKAY